jgi:plasmid stabilization system protein ParE
MAEVAWTAEAQRWLEDIFDFIATDNPAAAAATVQGIFDRAQVLKSYPEIGHRYLASSRKVLCLAVEKPRQYCLIASLIQEALLHLAYEFATPDIAFKRTRHNAPRRVTRSLCLTR